MDKEITIVGHGLAGCVLALTMYRRHIPFRMIGSSHPAEASMASSGLIAPLTGRRYVKAWRIDEYIAAALDFYRWTEDLFNMSYFFPVEIVRYLANEEANIAWNKRLKDAEYSAYISEKKYDILDHRGKPYGILTGGYRLQTDTWVNAARTFLSSKALLSIRPTLAKHSDTDHGITIFATGAVDPSVSLGIIPNKGEALVVRLKDWTIPVIIKEEVYIIPIGNDKYWVGSYYQPWPENPGPSKEGKEQLLQSLSKVYTGDIEVLAHLAGVRPTVDDRRPLIGRYSGHPDRYMFNGMGTKGTSLAPFWAGQLITHIMEGVPLPPEVSPARYLE